VVEVVVGGERRREEASSSLVIIALSISYSSLPIPKCQLLYNKQSHRQTHNKRNNPLDKSSINLLVN